MDFWTMFACLRVRALKYSFRFLYYDMYITYLYDSFTAYVWDHFQEDLKARLVHGKIRDFNSKSHIS